MIRVKNGQVTAMEFTSFTVNPEVLEDDFTAAAMAFEAVLAKQVGVVFHCLVKNNAGAYANVLLVEHFADLANIHQSIETLPEAKAYFALLNGSSVTMRLIHILKPSFKVPTSFSCIELGVFALKNKQDHNELLLHSDGIENNYLSTFSNTQGHFIGQLEDKSYAEVTFGQTYAHTKAVCYGYLQNEYCLPMLGLCEETSMAFDFWYVFA